MIIGWGMCIDFRRLNLDIMKDHFLLPFMNKILEIFLRKSFYYFLDGYSGYNQISVDLYDQNDNFHMFIWNLYI